MSEPESFTQLVARVRRGDDLAAEELIRRYEPDLRVIARVRLTDPALRRVIDSMDICQSIFANFFVRAAAGQFELETPEQLLRLLSAMVRNKVNDHARHAHRQRRDARLVVATAADELPLADAGATPSRIVANQELLNELHERLSDDERLIVEQRTMGREWSEIADQIGGTPEAARKRYSRAIDRAVKEMDLELSCYE
ncbi:MAG: sigma-70 family RNA polymerase sigma factor [Planctomycetes bacterium]|nr:sigma-70 family RNA polymerase sigma factor [Planctomycetota bacterium]